MKRIMILLVRLYQRFISPIKPATCRFTPTCSAYAIEAFEKRGFFAGLILTVWRILRCNPFCKGGYDPVPDKGFRRVRSTSESCKAHTESDIDAGSDSTAENIATEPEAPTEGADITEADSANTPAPRQEEKEN